MAGSQVANFYKNKSIFITGGTGFLGIALIEKILRSCPDIKQIYLLLRPKKGKTIYERLTEIKKNLVSLSCCNTNNIPNNQMFIKIVGFRKTFGVQFRRNIQ